MVDPVLSRTYDAGASTRCPVHRQTATHTGEAAQLGRVPSSWDKAVHRSADSTPS